MQWKRQSCDFLPCFYWNCFSVERVLFSSQYSVLALLTFYIHIEHSPVHPLDQECSMTSFCLWQVLYGKSGCIYPFCLNRWHCVLDMWLLRGFFSFQFVKAASLDTSTIATDVQSAILLYIRRSPSTISGNKFVPFLKICYLLLNVLF